MPRSDDADEADGWLLTLVVLDGRHGTSALHILNAEDIDGEAQAVVELPQRVPAGLPRQLGARPGLTASSNPRRTRPDRRPGRPRTRSELRSRGSLPVFVWQWVQQHRLLSVLVLAFVIVSSAGGTAWALVFRTVSSPVGLREALRMYRREQTGKVWRRCATGCRRPASTPTAPPAGRAST